jgi:hypothetical protein
MVEKEMALRNRMIRNKSFDEAVAVTMDLTNLARFLRSYYLDRLFRRAAAANKMGPDFGPETETIPAVDTGEADGLRLKVK